MKAHALSWGGRGAPLSRKEHGSIMQSSTTRRPLYFAARKRTRSSRSLAALVFSFVAAASAAVVTGAAQAQEAGKALPPGSYALSCESCSATGSALSCQCLDAIGGSGATTLALPCAAPIENCNGDLFCGVCPALPAGSYLQTCEGCFAGRDEVSCWCDSVCGVPKPTSINLSCESELSNCNGVLTCGSC